jgi:hypothetical protein
MLDRTTIINNTSTVLKKELERTVYDIKINMLNNNQVVTGRTARSLYTQVDGTMGFIAGAEHVDTLEKGISPERSRLQSARTTYFAMRDWMNNKGLQSKYAYKATLNQRKVGSLLYRRGGRKDVYTNEVEPLVARISEQIGDIFINTKIID